MQQMRSPYRHGKKGRPDGCNSKFISLFGVFFGETDHFVELVFAAEEFIIDLAQQRDLAVQIVPLLGPVRVLRIIVAPAGLLGIKSKDFSNAALMSFQTSGRFK